jgi:hypothetical protein
VNVLAHLKNTTTSEVVMHVIKFLAREVLLK